MGLGKARRAALSQLLTRNELRPAIRVGQRERERKGRVWATPQAVLGLGPIISQISTASQVGREVQSGSQ